jgi:hypothetical protein
MVREHVHRLENMCIQLRSALSASQASLSASQAGHQHRPCRTHMKRTISKTSYPWHWTMSRTTLDRCFPHRRFNVDTNDMKQKQCHRSTMSCCQLTITVHVIVIANNEMSFSHKTNIDAENRVSVRGISVRVTHIPSFSLFIRCVYEFLCSSVAFMVENCSLHGKILLLPFVGINTVDYYIYLVMFLSPLTN